MIHIKAAQYIYVYKKNTTLYDFPPTAFDKSDGVMKNSGGHDAKQDLTTVSG